MRPAIPPDLFAFLLCIPVLIYIRSILRWRARARGRPLPPGPTAIPLLGNIFDIPKSKLCREYRNMCATYGNILHLRTFGESVVVLGDAKVALDYLDKRSANTSDRKQFPMIELSGSSLNFGFFPYGPWWRRHRRAFWHHFDPRAVLDYRANQRDVAHKFLSKLLNGPEDLKAHIRYSFAATVLKVVHGINALPENDPYIALLDAAIEGPVQGLVPGKFLVDLLPFLRYIPTWFPGATSQSLFKQWQAEGLRLKHTLYEKVRSDMENDETQKEPRCVIANFITELNCLSEDKRAEETEIAKNVGAVALEAGADTTFSTMQALFVAMSLNSEVQKKAQTELDSIVGPDRLPDFEDEDSLVYIQAIVLETLRWHNVLPFSVPHCTTDDDELNGYFIPAGTVLIPNIWAYLHDPNVYDEPDAFRPERFIKDGKIDTSVGDPVALVFGFGRRICPGRYFALSSLYLNAACALHVFNIGPPLDDAGRPIMVTPPVSDGFVSYPEDCRCTIQPRSARAEELIRAHNR